MPDLNRLVRRVADSLGVAATAERVEAVARIVLEELSSADASSSSRYDAVVTITGSGISRLAQAVEETLRDGGWAVHTVSGTAMSLVFKVSPTDSDVSLQEMQARIDVLAARHGARAGVLSAELFAAMNGPVASG